MSEAKFTKGPWDGKTVIVRGLNFISHANYRTDEGNANAHLIAAAPELYEACVPVDEIDLLIDTPQDDDLIFITYGTMKAIKAALAKARGEV